MPGEWKLEPCPFCGGAAKMKQARVCEDAEEAFVECQGCDATTCHFEDAYAPTGQAADAWNRRATPTDTGATVDGGALAEIAAERKRQIEVEGWTPEHDDGHSQGEIATAAADYALPGQRSPSWSWAANKAKHPRRRQLVIAGALILAEIERLDRAASCAVCDGTGLKDHAGFGMDPCDHKPAALSPPSPTVGVSREEIARIIDPEAWSLNPRTGQMYQMDGERRERALTKADAILCRIGFGIPGPVDPSAAQPQAANRVGVLEPPASPCSQSDTGASS